MKCPKCGYERVSTDAAPAWQCPSCHVAYAKVRPKEPSLPPASSAVRGDRYAPSPQSLEQPEESETSELHWLAARGQRILILSIVFNFVIRAAAQSQALPELGIQVLFIAVAIFSLVGVLKACSGLEKTQNQKILFMVLSFLPFINLICLVYLSVKATKLLRAAGWQVGLMGAKP